MKARIFCALCAGSLALPALAQNWDAVPIIKHSTFQAVNPDGSPAYAGGFPVRLRGVMLNDPEDWLDPTFVNNPGAGNFNMGGQWEIFFQAVDLDGTDFDPFPGEPFDDFGGTASYMAQNYAGLPWVPEWMTYSEIEWQAELDRLEYAGGLPGVDPRIRAGDLIEIRARVGLHYQGKMNVNEQHNTDPAYDFEIVLLQKDFGRPQPAIVTIAHFKDEDNEYIFDWTRQTGGEHYQASWIDLRGVQLVDGSAWGAEAQLEVIDGEGRTLPLRLGRNTSFDAGNAPAGMFSVRGLVNQTGSTTAGYYLLALNASDVRRAGDTNDDGVVDHADLALLLSTYGLCEGDPGYSSDADFNGDGCVDHKDLAALLANYGS